MNLILLRELLNSKATELELHSELRKRIANGVQEAEAKEYHRGAAEAYIEGASMFTALAYKISNSCMEEDE